jgi:hypothetical protein
MHISYRIRDTGNQIWLWKLLKDIIAMRKRSKVFMSTWEMMRHSQIEEEIGRSLSL